MSVRNRFNYNVLNESISELLDNDNENSSSSFDNSANTRNLKYN
jgi:hypothetical protein